MGEKDYQQFIEIKNLIEKNYKSKVYAVKQLGITIWLLCRPGITY